MHNDFFPRLSLETQLIFMLVILREENFFANLFIVLSFVSRYFDTLDNNVWNIDV